MLNPLIYVQYFEPHNTIILSILEIPERERKVLEFIHDQVFTSCTIVREICKLSFQGWQKCELITAVTMLHPLVHSAFTINEAISPSPSHLFAFCFSEEKLLSIEELWSKQSKYRLSVGAEGYVGSESLVTRTVITQKIQ